MLEALIFDVDGTVAETEDMHRRAFNLAFARHGMGLAWSARDYRALLKVPGGRERITHALKLRGTPLDLAEVARVHATKTRFYAMLLAAEGAPWRSGVRRLMEQAWESGRAVALATTTSDANLDPLFAPVLGAGWRSRFAAVVTGEMVVRKKPAADAHVEALRRLQVPAARAVAFEDSSAGVTAAAGAGIAVIATPSAWFPDDDVGAADLVLEGGLDELPSMQSLVSWHREREAACSRRA